MERLYAEEYGNRTDEEVAEANRFDDDCLEEAKDEASLAHP
jgi:hypothetical protein